MKALELNGRKGYRVFSGLGPKFYANNPHYRGTEASIEKLLLLGPTRYHDHASVKLFMVEDAGEPVARFALIQDRKLPEYIQVSFFEASPNLNGILNLISSEAKIGFPGIGSRPFVPYRHRTILGFAGLRQPERDFGRYLPVYLETSQYCHGTEDKISQHRRSDTP